MTLKIAPFRENGKTYGTPTWIWEVVVNNELYAEPTTVLIQDGINLQCNKK